MNVIKVDFSIKDLENFTGIKAHTIRTWEKRYGLLEPNRSDTNIRSYSVGSLQKLLNISFLNQNGVKISKIAKLNTEEVQSKVLEIAEQQVVDSHVINNLKMAMLNFDYDLFHSTYDNLKDQSFEHIFTSIFLPLLNEIGVLWQTDTITPAHEHFISTLIKQKILLNIEKLSHVSPDVSSRTFVLFLPENEIHDIGILYINYHLILKGYHTIYLGENTPMESLKDMHRFFKNITFISYFTVNPEISTIPDYINNFNTSLLQNKNSNLLLLGQKIISLNGMQYPDNVRAFHSIQELLKSI